MKKALESALASSESSLLLELASIGIGGLSFAVESTDEQLKDTAEAYVQRSLPAICDKLKQSKVVRDFVKNRDSYKEIEIALVVIDIVLSVVAGAPAVILTTLIVRRGLERCCGVDCFDCDPK
jgi:hypothetical protein